MSLRWCPFFRIQISSLSWKLVSTLSSILGWILSIICRIEVFSYSSLRGLLSYTRDLRKPQRKKSHVDKSGERGGHGTSPNREMTWLLNKARTRSIEARAVWAVAPSCWNQTVRVFIPRTCNSGMKKLLIISMYRCELTVTVIPFSSKKYGPITHSLVTAHHTVTLGLCKGLWCNATLCRHFPVCVHSFVDLVVSYSSVYR